MNTPSTGDSRKVLRHEPFEVMEVLTPVDTASGPLNMVVGDDGDVHNDPEAGVYPAEEPPEVPEEDLDELVEREELRQAQEDIVNTNLARIVGILVDNSLPSQPQQDRVLSHPKFADLNPFAPGEQIAALANEVRIELSKDDEPTDIRFRR